ncbi:MAG: hypothetical protein JXR20_02310 [Balneola sp.]
MKNLLIAIGLVLFVSCSSFENENSNITDLQGTWELQRFSGGIGGWTTNLDTVDYTISLEVMGEKANWKRNDNTEMSYNIGRSSQDDFLLKFNPIDNDTENVKMPRYLLNIEGNEMTIMDSCFDCYIYYFVKS